MAGMRSTSVRYFVSLWRKASSLARIVFDDWRAFLNADFKSRLNSANIMPIRINNIECVAQPATVERGGVGSRLQLSANIKAAPAAALSIDTTRPARPPNKTL